MSEVNEKDGVFAVKQNLSASNGEYYACLEKRISHIYDLAYLAKKSVAQSGGDASMLKLIISGDETRAALEEILNSRPRIEAGEMVANNVERRLCNFDFMCFCKAISKDMNTGYSELIETVFGAEEKTPQGAEKKIALLRNARSSRAFELFAANIRGVLAVYEDNFQNACEAVFTKEAQYAVIPVSSSSDGRLDGLYRTMEKYGLAIVMSCKVSSADGNVTRFALAGRPSALTPGGEKTKFEFKITLDDPSELSEIAEGAEFFGAHIDRIDALPGFYGRENIFGMILDISDADAAGLMTYIALRFSQFVPIGIYSHITEE